MDHVTIGWHFTDDDSWTIFQHLRAAAAADILQTIEEAAFDIDETKVKNGCEDSLNQYYIRQWSEYRIAKVVRSVIAGTLARQVTPLSDDVIRLVHVYLLGRALDCSVHAVAGKDEEHDRPDEEALGLDVHGIADLILHNYLGPSGRPWCTNVGPVLTPVLLWAVKQVWLAVSADFCAGVEARKDCKSRCCRLYRRAMIDAASTVAYDWKTEDMKRTLLAMLTDQDK